jgi:hypothetical protein
LCLGDGHLFKSSDIPIHLGLKLSDFIQWAFSEESEVPWILREDISPQAVDGLAKVLDLLKRWCNCASV